MFSMVRIVLLMLFTSSIVMGGLGVQQGDSSFLKGGAGLLVVALLLIVIYKIIWKAMGCLIVIAILAVGGFMMFSGSGMMPDFGSISEMMSPMSGEKKVDAQTKQDDSKLDAEKNKKAEKPNFIELLPEKKQESKVTISPNMTDNFAVPEEDYSQQEEYPMEEMPQAPQPQNTVYGVARVINGDTIQIADRIVRLFGIDAPEPSQTCASRTGTSYRCGQKAAQELRRMLGNSEVVCNIMQQNNRGHAIGTCAVGPYDVGAAMVSNGWALAYRQFSGDVYVPYENSARSQQLGLWEGEFYMPWDWREQNTIQKKSILDNAMQMPTSRSNNNGASNLGAGILNNLLKMF